MSFERVLKRNGRRPHTNKVFGDVLMLNACKATHTKTDAPILPSFSAVDLKPRTLPTHPGRADVYTLYRTLLLRHSSSSSRSRLGLVTSYICVTNLLCFFFRGHSYTAERSQTVTLLRCLHVPLHIISNRTTCLHIGHICLSTVNKIKLRLLQHLIHAQRLRCIVYICFCRNKRPEF